MIITAFTVLAILALVCGVVNRTLDIDIETHEKLQARVGELEKDNKQYFTVCQRLTRENEKLKKEVLKHEKNRGI